MRNIRYFRRLLVSLSIAMRMSRRGGQLLFWWMIFFAMIASFVLLARSVLGAEVAAVEMMPLVSWDGMFVDLSQWFTDTLKEFVVIILSFISVYLAVRYARAMLDGRFKEIDAEIDHEERCQLAIDAADDKEKCDT